MTPLVRSILRKCRVDGAFLAFILFLPFVCLAQQERDDLFSAYPQDAPRDSAWAYHFANHSLGRFLYRDSLLAVSLSPDSDSLFYVQGVTADGLAWRHRDVFEFAIQAKHSRQLPAETMEKVKQAIAKLPAVQGPCPPRSELAIVSIKQGTATGAPRRVLCIHQSAVKQLLELIEVPN